MIEPFGPGTTNSTLGFNITASNYSDLTFGNVSITPDTTTGTYTDNKELITAFTSSLESQSIQLRNEDFGANNEVDFHVSGNVTHNPISLNNFTITKSNSNSSGGAFYFWETNTVKISNMDIMSCKSKGYGGAI